MVLAHLGHEVPEITLRDLCECDDEGTFHSKAVECAKHYGFVDSYSAYLGFGDLEAQLTRGLFPIVYLELLFSYGLHKHAVVVTSMGADVVEILDPHRGEWGMQRKQFGQAWVAMKGLTILVE